MIKGLKCKIIKINDQAKMDFLGDQIIKKKLQNLIQLECKIREMRPKQKFCFLQEPRTKKKIIKFVGFK